MDLDTMSPTIKYSSHPMASTDSSYDLIILMSIKELHLCHKFASTANTQCVT